MHIHILGICGTFMAGIAILAKQQGHHVTGSDANVYPPMSTQLSEQGIIVSEGYDPAQLQPPPDLIVIGNAMKRGNLLVETILNNNLPYISGPQWLAENILQKRWVLAVAGTHGKTTTSSMLAWILEHAGLNPGFLIGGIPKNFGVSAKLGGAEFFVIEADEYDTAFFDKRSKFILYHPRTLILNNLEFDHADIFPDLNSIKTQFHHLVRTVPGNGLIIYPANDNNINDVLKLGCWTPTQTFGSENADWQAQDVSADGGQFNVHYYRLGVLPLRVSHDASHHESSPSASPLDGNNEQCSEKLTWNLLGMHNVNNALAAIAAAQHVGVTPAQSIAALKEFRNVKRRMEIFGIVNGITLYDDFAHHPTAVATTLHGLRQKIGKQRIIAVLECGSYTMRTGVHKQTLVPALREADVVFLAKPKEDWGVGDVAAKLSQPAKVGVDVNELIQLIVKEAKAGDHVLIMSNTGFDGIHAKLLAAMNDEK